MRPDRRMNRKNACHSEKNVVYWRLPTVNRLNSSGAAKRRVPEKERRFDMKKFFNVKNLCLSGIIAALYVVLTILLQAISFGGVQLRVS